MSETGIVIIHGREYKTVARRVSEFRETHSIDDGWAILTAELPAINSMVRVEANIVDPSGRLVAMGRAEEDRERGQINKTSALENCETSAIGRALAAAGYGGAEYASANEVENAIHQQDAPAPIQTPAAITEEVARRLVDNDRELVKAWWKGPPLKTERQAIDTVVDFLDTLALEDGDLYDVARQRMNSVIDGRNAEKDGEK